MKNFFLIPVLVLSLLATVSSTPSKAQDTVQRIELKIMPFFFDYARFDPFVDLDSADLTVIINNSALLYFSNDRFYKLLKSNNNRKLDEATVTDYRVRCTLYLYSGVSEVLYMNRLGEFLYQDKVYKSRQVQKFIFEHIPNVYKD